MRIHRRRSTGRGGTHGGGAGVGAPGKSTYAASVQRKAKIQRKVTAAPSDPSVVTRAAEAGVVGGGEGVRVQRKADDDGVDEAKEVDETEDEDADVIAEGGVSGAGGGLPFRGEIQRSFGRHDVGGVRAHEGEGARDASDRLGARAFAYGDDVAFGETPDLHTAAHEAAHTVQQREGVARKARGDDDDVLEIHADRVADAVVAGRSAEPILDEVKGGGASATRSPQGKKKKNKKPREPRPYEASFEDISGAAYGDAAALGRLDVEWIDGLEPYVIEEIDREFHAPKVDAAFNKRFEKNAEVKVLKKAYQADLEQLEDDAKARLKAAGVKKPKKKDIEADDEYATAVEARTKAYKDARTELRDDQRAIFDAEQVKPKAPMMATAVPEDGVTRIEGRMLARADFVSWAVLALGSIDAAKAHFGAIVPVPGTNGMYLHAAASARYAEARAWFEAQYPGYTFHGTDVAMQLRNRHQEGHPQGKMGHPLGLSIDFKAFDNPNQLGDGVDQYMLRRFGGEDEDTPGANMIDTKVSPFKMTEEIGEATARGDELTKKQLAFLDEVENGFNKMAATSKRFQASLEDDMPELRAAETVWLEKGVPAAEAYRDAQDRLDRARKDSAKRHRKELKGLAAPEQDAIIDGDAKVVAAQQAFDDIEAEFLDIKQQVTDVMQEVFGPWTDALQAEVDEARGAVDQQYASLPVDVATVDSLIGSVKDTKNRKKLIKLIERNADAFALLDQASLPEDHAEARAVVLTYLKGVRATKWTEGVVGVKVELIRRLTESPWQVFGIESMKDKATGRTRHKDKVSDVTVMQYLEHGFVRDDAMPDKDGAKVGGKGAKGVFNGKFVRCMTQFGFNTLATWEGVDTMHFDFREGFSAVKSHELYSP